MRFFYLLFNGKPPTVEDFKKIKEKLKPCIPLPIFAIISAEDLNDLLEGRFKIVSDTHIEKNGHNIFIV